MSFLEFLVKYSKDSPHILSADKFESPVGNVVAVADEHYVYLICFEDSKNFEKMFRTLSREINGKFIQRKNQLLQNLESEMTDYFGGTLKKFTVPIQTFGSDFQKEVWNKLQDIPYASTQTYGDLAKAMGRRASHARAVGAACGANSHLLVIPCHRLVASGSNGGFSSGIERKEWLLHHEKK